MSDKVLWGVHRPQDDSYFACRSERDAFMVAKGINDCAEEFGMRRTAYPSSMIFDGDEELHENELARRAENETDYFI